jgi:hypothetical protein
MCSVRSSVERNMMSVPVHTWQGQLINQRVVRVDMISILGFIVYRSIYAFKPYKWRILQLVTPDMEGLFAAIYLCCCIRHYRLGGSDLKWLFFYFRYGVKHILCLNSYIILSELWVQDKTYVGSPNIFLHWAQNCF